MSHDVTIFQLLKPAQKQLTTGGGLCNSITMIITINPRSSTVNQLETSYNALKKPIKIH